MPLDRIALSVETVSRYLQAEIMISLELPVAKGRGGRPKKAEGERGTRHVRVFEDLADIRKSRHYRPGEHLYYFTDRGIVSWMAMHGFDLLERDWFETRAGRESIATYAFQRAWSIDGNH